MTRAAIASTTFKIGALAAVLVGLGYSAWRALPDAVQAPRSVAPSPSPVGLVSPAAGEELLVATARTPADAPSSAEPRDSEAEGPSESIAAPPQATRLAPLLDSVAMSFLSEMPDLAGFDRAARMLAHAGQVDSQSVHVDAEDGSIRGMLVVPGEDLRCRFQIAGSRYNVKIEPFPGQALGAPFMSRNVSLSFLAEADRASDVRSAVQYHPDARQPVSKHLRADQEDLVGWLVGTGPEGAVARPLTMQAGPDGVGWVIGHSTTMQSIAEPWTTDTTAYDLWLAKLRPFAR